MERVSKVERTADNLLQTVKNANIVVEGLNEILDENCIATINYEHIQGHPQQLLRNGYNICLQSGSEIERKQISKVHDRKTTRQVDQYDDHGKKGKLGNIDEYSKVFLNEDPPPKIKNERQVGYAGCKASGSKLVIDGKANRFKTLHLLPKELQLCNIKT